MTGHDDYHHYTPDWVCLLGVPLLHRAVWLLLLRDWEDGCVGFTGCDAMSMVAEARGVTA